MAESIETLTLRSAQQQQIIDQYRVTIYNIELRMTMMAKMLEEKNLFLLGEFDKRWPVYLKNDVGVIGSNGIMEGTLKVSFFG